MSSFFGAGHVVRDRSAPPPPPPPLMAVLAVAAVVAALFAHVTSSDVPAPGSPPADYCGHWRHFNASCPPEQVVLMTHASYGRMRVGRCLQTDYMIGCQANVLEIADRKCSGKASCVIKLPDYDMFEKQPCRKDLLAYLSAAYKCIPVTQSCDESVFSDPSGFLYAGAGYVDECRWWVHVSPGQRINLSLYTLDWPHSSSLSSCLTVATVREADAETPIRSCSRSQRRVHVHLSAGNRILVTLHRWRENVPPARLIIHYQVEGCADIEPSAGVLTSRTGEMTVVKCVNSSQTWHLVCRDTEWMGQLGNCSHHEYRFPAKNIATNHNLPVGIILAIGIGIILGIVLGVVLLLMVFACHRKRKRKVPPPSDTLLRTESCPCCEVANEDAYKLLEVRRNVPNGGRSVGSLTIVPPPPDMLDCCCHLEPHQQQQQQCDQQLPRPVIGDEVTSHVDDKNGVNSKDMDESEDRHKARIIYGHPSFSLR